MKMTNDGADGGVLLIRIIPTGPGDDYPLDRSVLVIPHCDSFFAEMDKHKEQVLQIQQRIENLVRFAVELKPTELAYLHELELTNSEITTLEATGYLPTYKPSNERLDKTPPMYIPYAQLCVEGTHLLPHEKWVAVRIEVTDDNGNTYSSPLLNAHENPSTYEDPNECDDGGTHEVDPETFCYVDGGSSSEYTIIDVSCRLCGRSGAIKINHEDIDW